MDRRTEIIKLASSLFRKKGYNVVTMRMLAKELEIKAASLYNHIKSKQELLEAIVIGLAEHFTAGMAQVQKEENDVIDKIKAIINLHIDITLERPDDMESLQNNWMYLDEENLRYFKQLRNDYEDDFRKIITEGIAAGVIKDVNPEVIIYSVLATLRSLYIWYPRQDNLDPTSLREDMATVLMKGIER